ncbi:hypothetical protein B0H19DRAFT_1185105 [Mycena capillaripes]|nr:hypothetical protein B0H19DRAFT_1185105 [Mycena capillaripes]
MDHSDTLALFRSLPAGRESFRFTTRSYYCGAAGYLLVYVRRHLPPLDDVHIWLADVLAHAVDHVSCICLRHKVDLCDGKGF